jgi:CPA2 family monovalent cation:H+ antiporter-2
MLASHTLVIVGVPLSRVMRRVSQVRDERYQLLRGLFYARDELEAGARLHAVTLDVGAHATGKALVELGLEAFGVEIRGVRRRGARATLAAIDAGTLQLGDVVVLLGTQEALSLAEERLLKG